MNARQHHHPYMALLIFLDTKQDMMGQELVTFSTLENLTNYMFHSPTPKGICSIFNGPIYPEIKDVMGRENELNNHFKIKDEV